MSELKTNKISPATLTDVVLGDSGDTFTIPSGATIVNSGTATGFGGGKVLQAVNFHTGAVATGTTIFARDDTIPQITEGDEFMTLAITAGASNKLLIQVVIHLGSATSSRYPTAALFNTDEHSTNALAVGTIYEGAGTTFGQLIINHYMTSPSGSATTFRVRGGANVSGTTTMNGESGNRLWGGKFSSSITITEISV